MKHFIISILLLLCGFTAASAQEACRAQRALAEKGFYQGDIDCALGPNTRHAIERFQAENGLHVDGRIGEDTRCKLFGDCRNSGTPSADDYQPEGRRSEESGQCGDDTIEVAVEKLFKSRALNGAVKAWQSKVYSTEGLGPRYGNWENATDKFEECLPASANAKAVWNCTVRGRPCKAGAN